MILYCEPNQQPAALAPALGNVQVVPDLGTLTARLGEWHVTLVVLGSGLELAEALAFVSAQRIARPALGVVLLRDQVDVAVLGEAIRAGVREVVDAADSGAVSAACARSLELSRTLGGAAVPAPGPQHAPLGQVVTVFAGKGGCGKSTMSTNLAVALAAGGARRVCLVDLDLSFGDVAIMMQLHPERSLVDAVPMAGRLDETAIRSLLTSYGPGIDALLAPASPADGELVTAELVTEVLKVAQRIFDYVVVDTPPFFSDQVLAALDVSAHYVLLATPDIPALKNLRLTLDMLDMLELPKEQRVVVLNRADARVGLTPADIDRIVRAPIVGHIPSTRDVPVSINGGVPLMVDNPAHPVSRAIRELAESRLGAPSPAETSEPRRRRAFALRKGR